MTDIVQTVKDLVKEVRALKAVGNTQAVADLQSALDRMNNMAYYPLTHYQDAGNANQTIDWSCANGVVTLSITWLHNSTPWGSGHCYTLPDGFAPSHRLSFPCAKQNRGSSETGDSVFVVDVDGSISWSNQGGTQGSSYLVSTCTWRL